MDYRQHLQVEYISAVDQMKAKNEKASTRKSASSWTVSAGHKCNCGYFSLVFFLIILIIKVQKEPSSWVQCRTGVRRGAPLKFRAYLWNHEISMEALLYHYWPDSTNLLNITECGCCSPSPPIWRTWHFSFDHVGRSVFPNCPFTQTQVGLFIGVYSFNWNAPSLQPHDERKCSEFPWVQKEGLGAVPTSYVGPVKWAKFSPNWPSVSFRNLNVGQIPPPMSHFAFSEPLHTISFFWCCHCSPAALLSHLHVFFWCSFLAVSHSCFSKLLCASSDWCGGEDQLQLTRNSPTAVEQEWHSKNAPSNTPRIMEDYCHSGAEQSKGCWSVVKSETCLVSRPPVLWWRVLVPKLSYTS